MDVSFEPHLIKEQLIGQGDILNIVLTLRYLLAGLFATRESIN